jgi:drug/metabolite transporter (DMT)-like permease
MADRQDQRDDTGRRGPGAWIAAVILIGVGALFFLQNRGYSVPGNLWSLLLLVPAAFALAGIVRKLRENGGRVGPGMAGSLITAIILVGLTVVFLLDIDVEWGLFLPVLLVVVGFSVLMQSLARR